MKGKDRKRIDKFLKGTLSRKEVQRLKEWMQEPKNAEFLKGEAQLDYRLKAILNRFDADRAYERNIILRTNEAPKRKFPFQTVVRYAAAMLAVAGTAGLLLTLLPVREETLVIPDTQVTLEMEDGSLMNIEPGENREILSRNGETISTQKQDVLYYKAGTEINTIAYNTLKVPYGKTFRVQLSDGSLVHLNAGTELKYPKQFIGAERRIYLKGEAFFEVAHNEDKPFIVETPQTDTRVLGTTFNVSAYGDEPLTATVLVEGSVLVYEKDKATGLDNSAVLTPGDLALWDKGTEKMSVSRVDVAEYTS